MDFPDSTVRDLIKKLKKDLTPDDQAILIREIEELSSYKKSQLFCLSRDFDNFPLKAFTVENEVWNTIQEIFKGEYKEKSILIRDSEMSLFLAENAVISEIFDLEDFRTVIRFLYTNTKDYSDITCKINQSVLRFLNSRRIEAQILSKFHSMLFFLGIPLARVDEIEESLYKLFPKAKSEIQSFLELPISTIQKYPEYLDETVEQLKYDEVMPILKKWLNNEILSKIEKIKVAQFTENWIPENVTSIDDLVSKIKLELSEKSLSSIPLVFDSFIKPYYKSVKPKSISQDAIHSRIPSEILQSYVEKLAYPYTVHKEEKIQIYFLGGATIGTMGILICTPKSNLLIDYGMSVANYQIPYWNEALNHLDGVLVTHAHLDHVGAIPYLYGQGFEGFVFGSTMTKNFANILMLDSLGLMKRNIDSSVRKSDHRFKFLSQPKNIHKMLDHYITVKPQSEFHISPDIVVEAIPANHIQGSYSYLVKCGEKKILFSGDVNMDPTSLFKNKVPDLPKDADLTIMDSTYYGQPTFNVKERDKLLFNTVKESKKVIIPAFSVGRAQEIMVKLEKEGITKERKITMLGMATKVARLTGLKTGGYLSDYLTQPFEDEVVISGGGMVNGGYARELIEQTKDDHETTIILCGYLAKNTMGYRLKHGLEPDYKQKIVFTRFSGHSSGKTLVEYLNSVKGKKVLVHVGDLSKDPITSENIRNSDIISKTDYYFPSLGSSINV